MSIKTGYLDTDQSGVPIQAPVSFSISDGSVNTLLANDTFTAADATLLASHALDNNFCGAGWTDADTNWKIMSNQLVVSAGATHKTYINLGRADLSANFRVYIDSSATVNCGVNFRSNGTNYNYIRFSADGSINCYDQADTLIAGGTYNSPLPAIGWHDCMLALNSAHVKFTMDNKTVLDFDDSTNNTLYGFGPYRLSGSPSFDNLVVVFSGSNLTSPLTTITSALSGRGILTVPKGAIRFNISVSATNGAIVAGDVSASTAHGTFLPANVSASFPVKGGQWVSVILGSDTSGKAYYWFSMLNLNAISSDLDG